VLENTPFIDNFPIDADSQFPCLMTSEASVNRDSETGGKQSSFSTPAIPLIFDLPTVGQTPQPRMYCYGPGHGVLLRFFVGQELASFSWVSSNMAGKSPIHWLKNDDLVEF